MTDIERAALRRKVQQAEIDLFAKYAYVDQAVSDPEFYQKRNELNLLKELLNVAA